MHGLAWLQNAPNVKETVDNGDAFARDVLIKFIDNLVCTCNPAVLPDGSNLVDAPPAQVNPHVCSQYYSQIEDYHADLVDLVATCQRHTQCSPSYWFRNKRETQS